MQERELGARTGGLWTTTQAGEAGLTRAQVRWRLDCGTWQRVGRGLLTDGGVVLGPAERAWAAVLTAGGDGSAAAAGRTAARLHGLPLVDDADPLLPPAARTWQHDDVVVARDLRSRGSLHVVRTTVAPGDLQRGPRGVPCTTPLRTLVDLAGLLEHAALVCAVDAALHRRLVTRQDLDGVVVARTGARGTAVLRRAAAAADLRSESPLESLARLLLRPVLPGLVPQVRVLDARGEVLARLDLADDRLRFGVECDGARHHAGRAALAADRARERRVAGQGYRLERVTWHDVRARPAATQARVLAAAGPGGAAAVPTVARAAAAVAVSAARAAAVSAVAARRATWS